MCGNHVIALDEMESRLLLVALTANDISGNINYDIFSKDFCQIADCPYSPLWTTTAELNKKLGKINANLRFRISQGFIFFTIEHPVIARKKKEMSS